MRDPACRNGLGGNREASGAISTRTASSASPDLAPPVPLDRFRRAPFALRHRAWTIPGVGDVNQPSKQQNVVNLGDSFGQGGAGSCARCSDGTWLPRRTPLAQAVRPARARPIVRAAAGGTPSRSATTAASSERIAARLIRSGDDVCRVWLPQGTLHMRSTTLASIAPANTMRPVRQVLRWLPSLIRRRRRPADEMRPGRWSTGRALRMRAIGCPRQVNSTALVARRRSGQPWWPSSTSARRDAELNVLCSR